jgi:dephospho-CoA kinase
LHPCGLVARLAWVRVIGLVGGIGSGKSSTAAILAELGAVILDADAIGHAVYRTGTPGQSAVVAAFGRGVVGPDGEIDRKRLGQIVFADPARLDDLNRIVHPLIRSEIAQRIDRMRRDGQNPCVVVEAAILLEAGWRDLVDEIWAVSAGRNLVVDRLGSQRGLSAAETDARIARQMTDAARRASADLVIENDGSLADLRARVERLYRERIGEPL